MLGYSVAHGARRMRAEATARPCRSPPLPAPVRLAGLPIALALWLVSLPRVQLDRIGDYGLIPLLPITFWVALAVLLVASARWYAVQRRHSASRRPRPYADRNPARDAMRALRNSAVLLGVEARGSRRLLPAPRRRGHLDPGVVRVPVLARLLQRQRDAGQGRWTADRRWTTRCGLPPFFNVLLIGPLFLIFRTFTADRRLVWSAIVIFFLGAWVGQDYFAPQACVYFLYLTDRSRCACDTWDDTATFVLVDQRV